MGAWKGEEHENRVIEIHSTLISQYILSPPGKSEVEEWSDMYTVTSQLMLKVHKEDDGVPVICQVEHPAVTGNLQTQRYLEVQCEYLSWALLAAVTKYYRLSS